MEDIFVIKGLKNDVSFFCPILVDKDTLSFAFSSIRNVKGFFRNNKFIIKIKNSKKTYVIKLSEDDVKKLNSIFSNEKNKAKEYYMKSITGSEKLWIIDYWVTTREVLESNNSPYFQRILRKSVEKFTGGKVKDTDEENFQRDFLDSIWFMRLNYLNDIEGIIRIKLSELYE